MRIANIYSLVGGHTIHYELMSTLKLGDLRNLGLSKNLTVIIWKRSTYSSARNTKTIGARASKLLCEKVTSYLKYGISRNKISIGCDQAIHLVYSK